MNLLSYFKCALALMAFLELPASASSSTLGKRHSSRLRGLLNSDTEYVIEKLPRTTVYNQASLFTRKKEFLLLCTSELKTKASDGMLSQVEFAEFLLDYCKGDPNKGPACNFKRKGNDLFASLAPEIQSLFVVGLCPSNPIKKLECLEYLNDEGGEFGYTEEAYELCVATYPLLETSDLIIPDDHSIGSKIESSSDDSTSSSADKTQTREKIRKQKKDKMGNQKGMQKNARKESTSQFTDEKSASPSADEKSASPSAAPTIFPDIPGLPRVREGPSVESLEQGSEGGEGISVGKMLGISAAGMAVAIFALASATKRRRHKDDMAVPTDPALDGCESIISEDTANLDFVVQKDAVFNTAVSRCRDLNRSATWLRPTIIMSSSSKESDALQPPFRTFPGDSPFRSAVSSTGFFRRQSSFFRRRNFENENDLGDGTFDDDSMIEADTKEGTSGGADASPPMNPEGEETSDNARNSRRAWRSRVSKPFFTVFGAHSGINISQEKAAEPIKESNQVQEQSQPVYQKQAPEMSRNDWKQTMLDSCDDDASLGSFADVSADIRKQFSEFDAQLTQGFVDLSARTFDSRAPSYNGHDDYSIVSEKSMKLVGLQRELAVSTSRGTDIQDSSEKRKRAPPTASSSRDNQVTALLMEDKPWRKLGRSQTLKLAKNFEPSRVEPANVDLTQEDEQFDEEIAPENVICAAAPSYESFVACESFDKDDEDADMDKAVLLE